MIKTRLKTKIMLGFTVFVLIPVVMLGFIAFSLTQSIIEKKIGEQTDLTLTSLSRNIRYEIQDMIRFSDFWELQPQIQDLFATLGVPGMNDGLSRIQMEKTLQETLLTHRSAESAYVADINGNSLGLGKVPTKAITSEELRAGGLLQEAAKLDGPVYWEQPSVSISDTATGDQNVLTQIRLVKNLYTLDNIGYLAIQFNLKSLKQALQFNTSTDTQSDFLLLDNRDKVFLDSQNIRLGQELNLSQYGFKNNGDYESKKITIDHRDYLVSVLDLELNDLGADGWKLGSIVPWSVLVKESRNVTYLVASVTFVGLLSVLFFNLFFVNQLIKIIGLAVKAMRKVEEGEFSVRLREFNRDETGLLFKGFNKMAEQIGKLVENVKVEQKKKAVAEIKMLQAQIRPHFLFNTLESINAMAVQSKQIIIAKMVQRLGKVLRMAFIGDDEITLRMEAEYLTNYLEIQNYRFPDLFDYHFDIPEQAMNHTILRLTLQPLVENCLIHGFAGMKKKGMIRLAVQILQKQVVILLEDNGVGIPPEKQEKLLSNSGSKSSDGTMGIGINNVIDRVKMHYGMQASFFLCSLPGHGTKIRIVLPAQRTEGMKLEGQGFNSG